MLASLAAKQAAEDLLLLKEQLKAAIASDDNTLECFIKQDDIVIEGEVSKAAPCNGDNFKKTRVRKKHAVAKEIEKQTD